MITFETLITIIITLIIGYISIMVALSRPGETAKGTNPPSKKGTSKIVISVFFLLCFVLVLLLYFSDSFASIPQLLLQAISVITPINGKAFVWEDFNDIFLLGYGALCIPIIIAFYDTITELKKQIHERILWEVFGVLLILFVSVWVEYYVSFSVYTVFMEFSLIHSLIANLILNLIVTVIPTGIIIMISSD